MISWQTAAHWPYVEAPFPFYLVFYNRAVWYQWPACLERPSSVLSTTWWQQCPTSAVGDCYVWCGLMGGTEKDTKAGEGDDSAQQQKSLDSTATGLKVKMSIADFPLYDGSVSPEDFLAQCSRLAGLGGISNDSLASIVAARCSGRALTVVNELEQRLGRLSLAQLTTSLTSHFSAQPTAAQAAMQLSRLVKGRMKAR